MNCRKQKSCAVLAAVLASVIGVALGTSVAAQNQELMDRVAEVMQETVQNKQGLAYFEPLGAWPSSGPEREQ